MNKSMDRRYFLKIGAGSIGVGALYQILPSVMSGGERSEVLRRLGQSSGERVTPFTFVQMSDTHVGFMGPPDPLGTRAFEQAVDVVNHLPTTPDLVIFTGDLTHDSEDHEEHAKRMRTFKEIAGRLNVGKVKFVPGEHDAGLDGGMLFREFFGETTYSFDHRGVHFVALDNVSRAKPEVGLEKREWLKKDLSRFSPAAPIVVFTHRPLFDLKPEWEWFTSDGDEVMNILAPFQNVTILYGHIHRQYSQQVGNARTYGARSLIFAFPDPEMSTEKKPLQFDKQHPFKNLGVREIRTSQRNGETLLSVNEVELTVKEMAQRNGFQQILRNGVYT